MRPTTKLWRPMRFLALALLTTGCGDGVGAKQLGDDPADGYALHRRSCRAGDFSEVSIHKSGGDWMRVPFAPESSSRTCDLKKLAGAQDVLGTGALGEGHYTQIRLTVSSAALYWDNAAAGGACAPVIAAPAGRSSAVEVPSGEVRLNREFDVAPAGATTITLRLRR